MTATLPLLVRLWRGFVRPHRLRLPVILVLMALSAGLTGLYPLAIERAFALFEAGEVGALAWVPSLILALTMAKALSAYGQVVVTQSVVLSVVAAVQTEMFRRLMAADFGSVTGGPSGPLISRFTHDATQLREGLSKAVAGLVDALTVVFLLAAMLWLDWVLSLIVLVVYPLAAWPVVLLGRRMRRVASATQAHVGDLTGFLGESVAGFRLIKTYGLEEWRSSRAERLFAEMRTWMMRGTRGRAAIDPLLEVLGGLAVAGVLAFAGWRIVSGTGTLGTIVGFITALLMAARPVRSLGTLHVVVQEGVAALERLFQLVNQPQRVVDRPGARPLPSGPGHLVLEGVSFAYRDGRVALDGLTLEARPGETTALVGPSGAGKSTLINLVPRLYDVTSGSIRLDGSDIRDLTLASLRGAVALVSQDVELFDDSVAANIAFGSVEATPAAIEAAARAAAAHDFILALPQGYATLVGERGGRLSGGQRQRLALARALLRAPRLLLLDEATSALDAQSERQVQEALERLRRGRTTLVIAHRLATVRSADRICVLDQGRLVEQGDHDRLVAQGGLYARLVRMQAFGAD